MDIPKKLKDEIWEYCRLNDISNIDDFIIKMIRQGYTIEKYGATPMGTNEIQEIEKIVEVPIEIIKEVVVEKEIIKEVPVEKIVTKIEYISDTTGENELIEKIEQLEEKNFQLNEEIVSERKIFSTKTEEMENNFQKERTKKDEQITNLSTDIGNEKNEHQKTKIEISKKDKEIEELKRLLDEEKNKTKKDNDIYGDERKGGWFGSNLLKKK